MTRHDPTLVDDPGPSSILKRHPFIIAYSTLFFGVLGFLLGTWRSPEYLAISSVVLEDRSTGTVFSPLDGGAGSAEELVGDQIVIIGSDEVAKRAAESLGDSMSGGDFQDVIESTAIEQIGDSQAIRVRFTAETSELAVAGANAILEAYTEVNREVWSLRYEDALSSLDSTIEEARAEAAVLEEELEALSTESPDVARIRDEMDAILSGIELVREELTTATSDQVPILAAEMNALGLVLDALEGQLAVELEDPDAPALSARAAGALERESVLRSRYNELLVDAALGRNGIALASPANSAEEVNATTLVSTAAGVLLGIFVGIGIGYLRISTTRKFQDPMEPAELLEYPLLGIVPVSTDNPVLSDTTLEANIAFRSLLSPLLSQVANGKHLPVEDAHALEQHGMFVGVISAKEGQGRTEVALKTSVATSLENLRVLLVDRDFAERGSAAPSESALLEEDGLSRNRWLSEKTRHLAVKGGKGIDFIGGNGTDVKANSNGHVYLSDLRRLLRSTYDVVMIDLPSMLDGKLSNDTLAVATHFLVVIGHGSEMRAAKQLKQRLDLLDVEPLGYIYTFPS